MTYLPPLKIFRNYVVASLTSNVEYFLKGGVDSPGLVIIPERSKPFFERVEGKIAHIRFIKLWIKFSFSFKDMTYQLRHYCIHGQIKLAKFCSHFGL
jgi:hypothetical protein